MKIAKNQKGKIVNILESFEEDRYYCPVCKEELIRNFGLEKQYFSHPKGKGEDCELKLKRFENFELGEEENSILQQEYYDKIFNDISVEMSDYTSEEGYKLTTQQTDIIFSEEDRIKVEASAGASKSTTLYYYSKERPNKRILYLVYNSSMKKEAEQTFGKLSNVTIKTIHGLAYGYTGKYYKDKLTFSYKPIDVIKDLNLDIKNNNTFDMAIRVGGLLSAFMLSDKEKLEDMDLYKDEMFNDVRDSIYNLANKLWKLKSEYKNDVKVEHDFYLKQFHLMKKDLSHMYDIVLLDEAQDSNMLTFDLINNLNINGVVFVGDKFQTLYKWRGATNVIDLLENAKEYKLNTSFRVSQNVAHVSNLLIKDVFDYDFGMKGFNDKNKIVDKINDREPYTLLSRTNSNLFIECIEALNKGYKRFYFEGGFNSYKFNDILDCYYFSQGLKVKNQVLNKFSNYDFMKEYAEENTDLELLSLIRAVENYGREIPNLINKVKNSCCQDKKVAEIIYSTMHKAKGQTYNNVKLANDTFDISNYFNKKYIENDTISSDMEMEAKNEICVLYVAITRSKGKLELNDSLKKYLVMRYELYNKVL